MKKYGKNEAGCYIDGAIPRSNEEITKILLSMLPETKEILFNQVLDEFYAEQIDDLVDALNEHTDVDYYFIFVDGDLILTRDIE